MSTLSNEVILKKADLALSELTSAGGVLQPENAAEFIRIAIEKPVILSQCYVTTMKSDTKVLDNVRFSGQVLQAGTAGTALPAADRQKPALGKATLTAQLFKGEVVLDEETLEDNIEQNRFKDTIMTLMAEAVARDMEKVLIQGDLASANPFLAKFDGIIVACTTNTSAAGSVNLSKTVLKPALKTMPDEFTGDLTALRFFTHTDAETDYRDSLADRGTVAGDRYALENVPALYRGIPIQGVSQFPIAATLCSGILTDPKNIALGIHRNIKVKAQEDASAGIVKLVISVRFDVKYVFEPAAVKVTSIKTT